MRSQPSLLFDDWSLADQALWYAIIAEGDILDGRGPGAGWAPATKANTTKAYGYWLGWLRNNGLLKGSNTPLNRLTPERIRAYIEHLESSVASSTIFTYVLDLLRFAQAANPGGDWDWLKSIKNRLWARAKPAKDKTAVIRASEDLFRLGLDLMETAGGVTCRYNPVASHQQYRDGLIISVLAARPVRLKNLAAIEIDHHFVRLDDAYWLRFEAHEVKNRKHIEVSLPEVLTSHIDRYRSVHRPVLLGTSASNRLWISRRGRPLSESVIRHHVKNRTRVAFGHAITPHLFRDCAATSVAIEDPDHVRIAASILGHHSLETTQRYYDQSQMLAAGRHYQDALSKVRAIGRDTRIDYDPGNQGT
jgi:integrase/recombinase XerD